VGDDDFGRVNLRRLERDGADVSAVLVSPETPTGSAFVRYREDGSRDFVFNIAKSAASLVALTEAARALIARAGAACPWTRTSGRSCWARARRGNGSTG
jgi:fructokinase